MTERPSQSADGSGIAQADNGATATVNYSTHHHYAPDFPRPTRAIHLNPPPALFIGREPELAALHQHLSREGSVAYIPGFPGRGKSTLANFYAHQHKDEYQSVHWLPCHSKSLVEIAAEFAWQLELKLDGDLEANLKQLRAHCARNRCLLILDNVDDEAPAGMLLGGRSSVLLTTWHTNLKFLRPVRAIPLPVFTEDQCFELFRQKIGAHEVDRHLAESRLLFERLEHHPFALDIAASLIREDRRYTIAGMAKNLPADIPALFAEAIATLSSAAQSLLAAMAACAPEGFRLSLAAEVAGFDEEQAHAALYEIRARSLTDDLDHDTHRYRLHALIREAAGTDARLGQRHASLIEDEFAQWETEWDRCINDLADWQQALNWSLNFLSHENYTKVDNLALYGFTLNYRMGRFPEAHKIGECMAHLAINRKDAFSTQRWYGNQSVILQAWGRLEEAMILLKKQEVICKEFADTSWLVRCYINQATQLYRLKKYHGAMDLHKRAVVLCEGLDNKRSLQTVLGNQAITLMAQGKHSLAMEMLREQEKVCEEILEMDGLQRSYKNQANIYRLWNKFDDAAAMLEKSRLICKQMNNQEGLAYCYLNAALLARDQRNSQMEKDNLNQALDLFTRLGMPRETATVQKHLRWANGNHVCINGLRLLLVRILNRVVRT